MSLEIFKEKKDLLISNYNKIKSLEILPISINKEEINNTKIDNYIQNLSQDKFIVSVCGQIKVGKSTLLNDLIFENIILPSADIPETAKITEISYSDKESFIVEFYTKSEWEELKKQDNGEYFNKYIQKYIDEYKKNSNQNINIEEILKKEKLESYNLSEINEYISARGKYTPFVKIVKIFYPSNILKDIVIVDTPGTNDPNKYRSDITKKWINNSDSVIYLMNAGQPLTKQDSDFIEEYLFSIPSEKILFALSKIDEVEDISNTKEYVENCFKNYPSLKKWVSKNKIYPISQITSLYLKLLNKHDNNEIELSYDIIEDIEYQFDRIKSTNYEIIDNQGYIPTFTNEIENNLINNKGKYIIESHTKKIKSIFEYSIININLEIENNSYELSLLEGSINEIKEQEIKIKESKKTLQEINKNINLKKDEILNNLIYEFENTIIKMNKLLKEKIFSYIDNNPPKILESNLIFEVKLIFEEYLLNEFQKEMNILSEKFNKDFDNLLKDFKLDISSLNVFSVNFINNIFKSFSIIDFISDLNYFITSNVSIEKLKSLKEMKIPLLNMFKNIFNLEYFVDEQKTKSNYKIEVLKMIDDIQLNKKIIDSFRKNTIEKIDKLFTNYKNEISNELEKMNQLVLETENKRLNIDETKEKINKEINKLIEKRESIQNEFNNLKF